MNPITHPIRMGLTKPFETDRDIGRGRDKGRDTANNDNTPPVPSCYVSPLRCDDCGFSGGEILGSRFDVPLCFGCYQRRHKPRPAPRKPRGEVLAELARIGKAWRDGEL